MFLHIMNNLLKLCCHTIVNVLFNTWWSVFGVWIRYIKRFRQNNAVYICIHAQVHVFVCLSSRHGEHLPLGHFFYLPPALFPSQFSLFFGCLIYKKTPLSAHILFYSAGKSLWLVPLIKTSPWHTDKKCCCQPRLPRPISSILHCRRKWIKWTVLC